MRKGIWLGAALLALALARPAHAQRTLTFGGTTPKQIVNVPIDTSHAVAPFPQAQLTRPVPTWAYFCPRWLLPFSITMGGSGRRGTGAPGSTAP